MKSDADLTWIDDNAPYSRRFKDRYFSAADGRQETREVFLTGNGLPKRWQSSAPFHIAELGFGTGLNFFETLSAWQKTAPEQARLTYTSFEQYPLAREQIGRALANWPDLANLASPLLAQPSAKKIQFGNVELNLILGDARHTVAQWGEQVDAWYLDGFSPAKNPQLWELDLMHSVFDHTKIGGTFSTYTAAGFVRRNVQRAGFNVRRVQGFGNKRERLQGHRVR
ncbi:MAG: tRNA (5-methylaminomethyl-2-thiouridine)(34)-methyltransferase MnmD [bacterium]|nr:tRNA (5-methylaminomethyl-2-thiouridine)(34)-methyltransferase MnmD [bacterium]